MTTAWRLLVLLVAIGTLADSASAAKRVKIEDIEAISLSGKDNSPLSSQQVKALISETAVSLGWKVVESTDAKVRLELTSAKYSLTIDLPYNEKGHGLYYVDSKGLVYNDNGRWRGIHSSYKRWTDNLMRAIQQAARGDLPAKPGAVVEEKPD